MKITYDPRYNIAYILFRDKNEPMETLRLSDEVNIDLAPDGRIYGIELLNANQQLAGGPEPSLIFVNEAEGRRQEIAIL
ncbi:MAG: DUF2283 domain-containing protein [Candidatus Omnitrophota bacterium]